jgi:hypothetical protein
MILVVQLECEVTLGQVGEVFVSTQRLGPKL